MSGYGDNGRKSNVGNLLIACAVAGTLAYVAYIGTAKQNDKPDLTSTKGWTPIRAIANRANEFEFHYGRSTRVWVESAAKEFNNKNEGNHKVVLVSKGGSRDTMQAILNDKAHPTLWSPADRYWTDKLGIAWRDPKYGSHKTDVIAESQPILRTLFVLLMWKDRAEVFQKAMKKPQYKNHTWKLLHDIGNNGWASIGGSSSWGRLKLAQTEATESNSGQAALTLMYSEYKKDHPDATESSAGFLSFMKVIEGSVNGFGDTTSKMVDSFIAGGPGQADMALCYESNALQALNKNVDNLNVVYPTPTLATDYPVALISAEWVSDHETKGAKEFMDLLVSAPIQKLALDSGFRPVAPQLRSDLDAYLAKPRLTTAGLILDPDIVVRPVSTKIVDGLIYMWHKNYGK